jgi:hypothetical protein
VSERGTGPAVAAVAIEMRGIWLPFPLLPMSRKMSVTVGDGRWTGSERELQQICLVSGV